MSQPTPVATTWVNGRVADNLPVTDRGLAYGDGLFETLRACRGTLPLQALHLARLQRGCAALRIPFQAELIAAELNNAAARVGDGVVKLILTRGTGQRGYAMPVDATPSRVISISPLPLYPSDRRDGVHLFACTTRLADQPLLAGIKHLNRLEQVLARSDLRDNAARLRVQFVLRGDDAGERAAPIDDDGCGRLIARALDREDASHVSSLDGDRSGRGRSRRSARCARVLCESGQWREGVDAIAGEHIQLRAILGER